MKFLVDLANMNVMIEKEDKSLILLSFLPDENYETFIFTLINVNNALAIMKFLLLF